MQTNKLLTLLGFAAKAGKLSYGMDASLTAMKEKKAYLVLAAGNVSPKSQKELNFFADKYSVKSLILKDFDIETVSHAVGRKCGILAVLESGFAVSIDKAYLQGGNANDQ